MFCKNCGKELEDSWVKCPYCGNVISENQNLAEVPDEEVKKFELTACRRTGRFTFRDIISKIAITQNEINVVTENGKKQKVANFRKTDVDHIEFSYSPEWGVADYVRVAVFALLMFMTKGLSIIAVGLFIKMACTQHVVVKLKNGQKVKIPICQKGDASEFLRVLGYPEEEISKNNRAKKSFKTWALREWIITMVWLALAAVAITTGMEKTIEKNTEEISSEAVPETDEIKDTDDSKADLEQNAEETEIKELTLSVTVVNNTGVDIYGLFASTADIDNWEEDILGDNILWAGESFIIEFTYLSNQTEWDFAMSDSAGEMIEFYGLDFSEFSDVETPEATLILEYDGESGYASLE